MQYSILIFINFINLKKMKPILKKIKIIAAVIGASGYSGLELLKLLNNHEHVDIGIATSNTYGGQAVSDVFPSFKSNKKNGKASGLQFVPLTGLSKESFYSSDVVFLCLPSFASMEFVNKYLMDFKGVIIDIGSDFRINDEKDFELWYGKPHIAKKLLKEFVYGLPEIYEEKIKASRYIANPGCYPTSVILALAPLLSCKDLEITNINIDSKSGVSGAGRKLKNDYLFCSVNDNFFAYSALMHRHTGEIEQELSNISGKNVKVCFTPHLLPVNRGIFSSVYCKVEICSNGNKEAGMHINPDTGTKMNPETDMKNSPNVSPIINSRANQKFNGENGYKPGHYKQLKEMIFGLYDTFYSNAAFVSFLGEKVPQMKDVVGTNFCQIGIALDERTGTLKIFSTIDNLLKGAAGQAVQNMNLIFNLDQKEGLSGYGIFS
jgi:N-acetyl-gamma-glutamyl-phosphate reductase